MPLGGLCSEVVWHFLYSRLPKINFNFREVLLFSLSPLQETEVAPIRFSRCYCGDDMEYVSFSEDVERFLYSVWDCL